MPRLSTRQKATPQVVQLKLDFDTPTHAERDAALAARYHVALNNCVHGDQFDDIYRRLVETLRVDRPRQSTVEASPCRCPSCAAMPVALSMSAGVGHTWSYGHPRFDHHPRVELTCHCGQHWFLPQGWEIIVRDRAAPPDPNEILLIEDYVSMVYTRPPEQPYENYQPYYTGSFTGTYSNAVNTELSYEYLRRTRQRMQDEIRERAVMQYRMALP